jgi:hypothetical protein
MSRERAMGRRGARGERFAKLPVEVLEHPACTTLTGAQFRVLVILAAGFNGWNNGALACTRRWAQRFGVAGSDTTLKALPELARRGLIEVTRRGAKLRKVPTLYGLSWQPMHNRDGQPLATAVPPSWRFVNWQGAADDLAPKSQRRKRLTPIPGVIEKKLDPDPRGSVTPMVGVKGADLTPKTTVSGPDLTPRSGHTLRISMGGRGLRKHKPGAARSSSDFTQTDCTAGPAPIDPVAQLVAQLAQKFRIGGGS